MCSGMSRFGPFKKETIEFLSSLTSLFSLTRECDAKETEKPSHFALLTGNKAFLFILASILQYRKRKGGQAENYNYTYRSSDLQR